MTEDHKPGYRKHSCFELISLLGIQWGRKIISLPTKESVRPGAVGQAHHPDIPLELFKANINYIMDSRRAWNIAKPKELKIQS